MHAITDVDRVTAGHATLIKGGDIRTGVAAILQSLLQAEIITGRNGNTVKVLPVDKLVSVIRSYRKTDE